MYKCRAMCRYLICYVATLLFAVGALLPASALTYHVSTTGSNSNNGLTEATAWKNISKASGLSAGDLLLVHPGTYTQANQGDAQGTVVVLRNVNGSYPNPITIKADGPGVVIRGSESSGINGLAVENTNHYVIIDGFEFQHCPCSTSLTYGPERITIKNCTFNNTSVTSGQGIYIYGYNSSTVPIEGITIENCAWHDITYSSWFNCIRCEGGTVGMKVRNCTFDDAYSGICWIGYWGPESYPGNYDTDVRNNIFSNLSYAAIEYHGSVTGIHEYNMYFNSPVKAVLGEGEFFGIPSYIGGSPYNCRLGSCSEAIDIGVDVGLPYLGAAPDLGAFESDPSLIAQDTYIHGIVTDSRSGAVIPYAVVQSLTTGELTKSGQDGSYRLCLQPGTQSIRCDYGGLSVDWSPMLIESTDTEHNFELTVDTTATTYYVKPDGNDALDGKSIANAWATIDNGDRTGVLNAGDIVEIQAGTYANAVISKCAGVAGYPITYHANGIVKLVSDGVNRVLWVKDTAHHTTFDGFEVPGAASPYGQSCIDVNGVNHTTIANFYIHPTGGGEGANRTSLQVADSIGSILRNNVTQGMGTPNSGDWMWSIRSCTDTKIYNNLWNNGYCSITHWDGSIGTEFRNNIVTKMSGAYVLQWLGPASWTQSNNCFFNCVEYALDAGDIFGDPKIVGSGLYPAYYKLNTSSPCIDAGIDVGLPKYQLPDIGAFESSYSAYGTACDSIFEAKTLGNSEPIRLAAKNLTVATGTFTDASVYIEDSDRSSGIRVVGYGISLPDADVGDAYIVNGKKYTDYNGQPYISATSVIVTTGEVLGPLGMTNKAFGANYGLASTGLLVRVWGLVTVVGTNYIYVDDGSGFDDGSGNGSGVRVKTSGLKTPLTKTFEAGVSFARVTGAAALDTGGVTCVKVRGDADIDM